MASSVRKFFGWLSKAPEKGTPVDQRLAWETAHQLVEDWKVGWKNPETEQPDRGVLLAVALRSDAGIHLLQVMRTLGPLQTFTEVGADPELAANIVTVGTALELFQLKQE